MWRGLTGRGSFGHAGLALSVACLCVVAASILLSRLEIGTDALKLCLQISLAVAVSALCLAALFFRRITEDRRQIAESEQRFRRAMEDSAIGIAVVGLDGRILETNPPFAAMLGYSREEIEALTFFQITHPDDLQIGAIHHRRDRRAGFHLGRSSPRDRRQHRAGCDQRQLRRGRRDHREGRRRLLCGQGGRPWLRLRGAGGRDVGRQERAARAAGRGVLIRADQPATG
jgi:PAS domain S-box-containing protein